MDASPSLSSAQPFTLASDPGSRGLMDANDPYKYSSPMSAGKNTFTGDPQNRVLNSNFAIRKNQAALPLPYSPSTATSSTFQAQ